MKVCLKGLKHQKFPKQILKDFLEYLQTELPLKNDVTILFTSSRKSDMTTGVRLPQGMKVLADGRMLIDIFRTLAHEWVHEYQHQVMGLSDDSVVPNIGGPYENMANALSGIFIKKFQNNFPNYSRNLYEQKHS